MSATRSKFYLSLILPPSLGAMALPGCGSNSLSAPMDPSAIPARAAVAASEQVPPPSYVLKFDGLQLIVDANAVVQPSSAGTVLLQAQSAPQAVEEWKIFDETQRCCQNYSFSEIDRLYKSSTPIHSGSLAVPADFSISWSRFGLVDKALPLSRSLVIQRTSGSGLRAYQLFNVMFPGPSS